MYQHLSHTFEPIYDASSKIMILGTFPSVKSRETDFYYGHKQNRFWKVIAALTNSEIPVTILEKKALLLSNGIAIWDVISQCDIIGSSDSSIKNVVPNDILSVLQNSNITKLYANGATAKRLYDKYTLNITGQSIALLPSISPANAAFSLEKLICQWKCIKENI